jgi:ergothioneine biosynthesis protein EgtB
MKSKVDYGQLRESLRRELAKARDETDRLFQMLAPKAMYERPIPERHRVVFYLGHLEAFDWNMVAATSFGLPAFNAPFNRLFEFGIDPVDGGLPQDQPSDWPSIPEILSYRNRVRETVDDLLSGVDFGDSVQPFVSNGQIFHVAIEHRWMHAETLAYMFHWLDYDLKRPSGPGAAMRRSQGTMLEAVSDNSAKRIPAGEAMLGQRPMRGAFGWDNEFQPQSIFVPEFFMDTFNVTNRDFLAFVLGGGYEQPSLWSPEGWEWTRAAGIQHPKFWIRRGDDWFYRTMFEEVALPKSWPVYVSYAEAEAYARWRGKTLPTEAQFHRAAFGSPAEQSTAALRGNFDFRSWSPEPVGAFPESAGPFGVHDLVGNGWEWTSTPFGPFEGFKPFAFYPGYSASFFDGKHFVLKGASPRTAAALVRPSFRNWFQPYYPNIYAGFRCVQ